MSLSKWYLNKAKHGEGEDDEIEKVFELLEEGESKIELDENHKDPIFMLGNTGSGKSTLVQFIATDNKALHAEETYPGSNEYIIVDDNESIGGGTISKTTFPTLVVNKDNQVAFYDCPGFNDTRSPSNEIAASYFIKKVFDFAEELKIVLTVNYSSVRPGVDRKDFKDLMKHTVTLVKDIDKYQNSITIFATKVENQYVKDPEQGFVLVSDENVINNVANFLESVKNEIEQKVQRNVEGEEFDERVKKLITTLLTKDSLGNFKRIGIFRRPDEAGPLLGVELLQERKPVQEQAIYEAIRYTKKDSEDFGHTISDTAKLQVNKMVDRIQVHVSMEIDLVVAALEIFVKGISEKIIKIVKSLGEGSNADTNEALARSLAEKLNSSFDEITKLKFDVGKAETIKDIAKAIEICGTALNIDTEVSVSNLMRQDNYFEFLQNVKGGLSIGDYSKNFDGITVIQAAVRNEIEMNTENMADSVERRLKNNLNDVVKMLDVCYDNKFESLSIEDLVIEFGKQHQIVVEFVEKIKTIKSAQELSNEITSMVSNSEIESTEISAATLDVLNYGNYLTVLSIFNKGINVWSSDWIKPFEVHTENVFKSENWYSFLQRLYTQLSSFDYLQHSERYNVANIDDWGKENKKQGLVITKTNYKTFLEKVNEDDKVIKEMDLDERKLRELNHVPELTIKQKIFSYMGENGDLEIEAVFVKFSDFVDSNGKLKPELCDGMKVRSVNIFATDTVFIDQDLIVVGEKLKVNVVAPNFEVFGTRSINLSGTSAAPVEGQASNATKPGDKGADGSAGMPGGSGGNFLAVGYDFKAIEKLTIISNGGRGGKGQKGGNGAVGLNGADADNNNNFESDRYHISEGGGIVTEYFRFFGKHGGKGGDGGDGGVGGLGGLPGNTEIIRKDGLTAMPVIRIDEGSLGEGNIGGAGAKGGKRGNNLKIAKTGGYWVDWSRKVEYTSEYASNGHIGVEDFNDSGRQQPEKVDYINIADIVNIFESYLRQDLHDRFLQQTLKKFLDALNHDTNEIYDTNTLAENLSNLEAQLHELTLSLTNADIIYLYQSILDRTIGYSKNPKPSEDTKEYGKALKYICTAVLCQIQVRKDTIAPNLIIDVARYLNNVLKNVNVLKDLTDKANKLKVVNESTEKYESYIDKKIEEALRFIEKEILPEFENVYKQLNEQIDKLVEEVIKLQEAAVVEIEKLKETKSRLQGALGLSVVIGALRVALVFMGPVGGASSLAISLIQGIVASSRMTRSIKASDLESLKLQIKEVKKDIEEAKANKPDPELLGDIKKRYSGDKPKLSTIDDAIEAAKENLLALQEYEKQIYDSMVPMLNYMEQMLDEVSAQLESQSQVALDVTKWKVQSTLRDVKLLMKQMTRGFFVEDDLLQCIEKLEEAMTIQINLYDRIQSYQDQKMLADYIGVVSTGTDESNPALSQTLRNLELMIRSQLVLDQHKQAKNALTQNVFPFAHLYLNDTSNYVTFSVKTDEDFAKVVAETVKKLEIMKENIEKYKTSIGKQDEYITSSQFNSDYVSVEPFYVWKNDKNNGFIAKLLAGEKVIIYSDVRRENADKYAIKFNLSEINFKASDTTIQCDINEKLKKFKANMTHMGTSYYRFRDGVYIIHSESQKIQFTFERAADGNPTVTNGIYDKIKNGDLMLSPFAMWEMQITKAVEHGDFEDLKKFADHVNLELVGKGNYVTQDLDVGVLYVENYYTPEPTMLANDKW